MLPNPPLPINNVAKITPSPDTPIDTTTINNYSEPEDTTPRAFFFSCKLNITYSVKNKACAIPSGTFIAYEFRAIGVRERHHDIKARMSRGLFGRVVRLGDV